MSPPINNVPGYVHKILLLKPHFICTIFVMVGSFCWTAQTTNVWQNTIFVHFCGPVVFLSETRDPQSFHSDILSKRPWHWAVLCGQNSLLKHCSLTNKGPIEQLNSN